MENEKLNFHPKKIVHTHSGNNMSGKTDKGARLMRDKQEFRVRVLCQDF